MFFIVDSSTFEFCFNSESKSPFSIYSKTRQILFSLLKTSSKRIMFSLRNFVKIEISLTIFNLVESSLSNFIGIHLIAT